MNIRIRLGYKQCDMSTFSLSNMAACLILTLLAAQGVGHANADDGNRTSCLTISPMPNMPDGFTSLSNTCNEPVLPYVCKQSSGRWGCGCSSDMGAIMPIPPRNSSVVIIHTPYDSPSTTYWGCATDSPQCHRTVVSQCAEINHTGKNRFFRK